MLRRLNYPLTAFIVLLAIVLGLLGASLNSSASATTDEPCVPKDAYTETVIVSPAIPATPGTPAIPGTPGVPAVPPVTVEHPAVPEVPAVAAQHYSWTGGRLSTDNPPTVVPPHDDWQENTSQEPHDSNGNPATWVNESLHYTANSKGHASWFYFTPAKPAIPGVPAWTEVVTPGTPAIPAVPEVPAVPGTPEVPAVTKDVFHPAVTCPPTPTETPTVTVPTETPTVATEVPTPTGTTEGETTITPTPETPTTEDGDKDEPKGKPGPKPEEPAITTGTRCEDGVFVTTTYKDGELVGEVTAGTCGADTAERMSVGETGI